MISKTPNINQVSADEIYSTVNEYSKHIIKKTASKIIKLREKIREIKKKEDLSFFSSPCS